VRQLRAAGARRVFREVAAGAKTDRPQLRRLLAQIGPGDVVTVTRIDRLARSIIELFAIVKRIIDANKRNSVHWPSRGPTPAPEPGA
jgi:DNA invertase Pin-like site-specific DNA recombinase